MFFLFMYRMDSFLVIWAISGLWITPQAALMVFILPKNQGTFSFT